MRNPTRNPAISPKKPVHSFFRRYPKKHTAAIVGQAGDHVVELLQHGIQMNLVVDMAQVVLTVDQIHFVAHFAYLRVIPYSVDAACSCGLVVMIRYSSVSLGKWSTKGRITEP